MTILPGVSRWRRAAPHAPPRLAEKGDLFRPALDDPQDLLAAIEALQARLRGR